MRSTQGKTAKNSWCAFLTRINLSADPFSVTIGAGLAFVAGGSAGLQVVNYRSFDNQGVPPTITLEASFPITRSSRREEAHSPNPELGDPNAEFDQSLLTSAATGLNGLAEEGKLVRVSARVTDDVQVRNVEFYMDGARVFSDASFPFEHRFLTPLLAIGRSNFTVRARALDTGGNFAWSDEMNVTLTPDMTPPRVVRTFPGFDGIAGAADTVAAFFNEPLDAATVNAATIQLTFAGTNGVFGDSDDVALTNGVISYRNVITAAFLNFPTNLPPGMYRAVVSPPLADLSGNPMTKPFRWQFWALGTRDSDQDGLPDEAELALGLDPNNPDTNGNGILDGDEDMDGDNLPNKWELRYGYEPRVRDTDNNGVPDSQEDPDFDRLNNLAEFSRGLNPLNTDTDGDGWDDATEILDGTNPLNPASGARTTVASAQVGYFNGLLDTPSATAQWTVFSAPASYFNGLPEVPPTNVVWSVFSPTVSFFNGIPEPGPTNVFLLSPIVSYENE